MRLQRLPAGAARAGIAYDPELVLGVPHSSGPTASRHARRCSSLPEPPDAVFCFNDLMAVGALRACVEAGVRCPSDVAIAGFDDIAEGRFHSPSLTTIAADLDVLSEEALRLLLLRVGGEKSPAASVKVPWTLQIRESTVGRTAPRP